MPYKADLPAYNGWTNYATWNAMLWLGNDDAELWEAFLRFCQYTTEHLPADKAREAIKRWVTNYIKRINRDASCRADLEGWARRHGKSLRWALDQIDWDEIVAHMRDAVKDALPATTGEDD